MDYIDKYTHLMFFEKKYAYGDSVIKNNKFAKTRSYHVAVDGDKMILLSPKEIEKSSASGTDGEYFIESTICECSKLRITGLYSIKKQKLLNVENRKLLELYKQMFWLGRAKEFELAFALSEINSKDLGILTDEEKKQYYSYLTSGNKTISHDEVVNYILRKIPKLEKYSNLKNGLSIAEYRLIAKDLGTMLLALRPIPQDLEFLQYDESIDPKYREVYIPEADQKQRVLTYRRKK